MARGNGYFSGLERPKALCDKCYKPRTRVGKDGKRICKECRVKEDKDK